MFLAKVPVVEKWLCLIHNSILGVPSDKQESCGPPLWRSPCSLTREDDTKCQKYVLPYARLAWTYIVLVNKTFKLKPDYKKLKSPITAVAMTARPAVSWATVETGNGLWVPGRDVVGAQSTSSRFALWAQLFPLWTKLDLSMNFIIWLENNIRKLSHFLDTK